MKPIQTQAEKNVRRALRADAKTHVGKYGAPVWVPPKPVQQPVKH